MSDKGAMRGSVINGACNGGGLFLKNNNDDTPSLYPPEIVIRVTSSPEFNLYWVIYELALEPH